MTTETQELQAPPGTYQRLTSLESGRLGNTATKRFVRVCQMPDVFPSIRQDPRLTDDMTVAWLTIRIARQPQHIEENHVLGIKPTDQVVVLDSYSLSYKAGEDGRKHPYSPPPPLDSLLKEISIAERLQPKLKRR